MASGDSLFSEGTDLNYVSPLQKMRRDDVTEASLGVTRSSNPFSLISFVDILCQEQLVLIRSNSNFSA